MSELTLENNGMGGCIEDGGAAAAAVAVAVAVDVIELGHVLNPAVGVAEYRYCIKLC